MALQFEVLGFAGAAPLQGACPAYLVSSASTNVLLDCGPGALERLWRKGLVAELDAIVISHMHADHILDLTLFAGDVVREQVGERNVVLYVPVDAGRDVLARLDAVFARTPRERTRFDLAFDVREYRADEELAIADLDLRFAITEHAQPCFAARVTDGSAALVYGADGSPGAAIVALARGADLVVLEATFAEDEELAAEHGHMTAAQAGVVASQAGASRLLLTHLLAGASVSELLARAQSTFEGQVDIAHEGYLWRAPA